MWGVVGGVVALVAILLIGGFFVVMRRRINRGVAPSKRIDDEFVDSVEQLKRNGHDLTVL